MTTPTTPISFLDIQNEFGGANPISMSEYYQGGAYVPAAQSYGGGYGTIPSNGTIGIYSHRNKQKFVGGALGFAAIGTLAWVVPPYLQSINIRAMGAGGGGGGGSARAGRESQQEAVGGGGGGGSGTVYQSTSVVVVPDSTIYIVIGAGGSGGGGRDGTYSAGSSGGAGGHSGVLNSTQGAWHCLSYGGGGGTVGQDNAQAARGVRGADRAAGVGAIYNYGWNSGYGTVGKNDTVVTGDTGGKSPSPTYGYNATGGTGAQGYSIWGDSTGTTGQGGGFYNGRVISDYGTTTYVYPTTANSYGGGGGGGAGADRNGYSGINGAAGNVGGVVIWW